MIRKTRVEDIPSVMRIIQSAQSYFRENGIPQWQNGYPDEKQILNDIKKDGSYVLEEENQIVGTFFLTFKEEESYKKIYDGKWLNDEPYAAIHRIAIDSLLKGKGLASKLFACGEEIALSKGIKNIRIDTHEYNKSMQKALNKNGYIRCGNIFLSDGSPRIGFQKVIHE